MAASNTAGNGGDLPAPKGRYAALVGCWVLGLGSLISWNSILTIGDYYGVLFPKYHPSRVLTLVYQPFALGTTVILTHYEANLNTRLRNLTGYLIFFTSSLLVIVIDLASSGKGGIAAYVGICAVSCAFGIADGHVQGGMIGDLSLMDPGFIQAFMAGLCASGAIASGLRFITRAALESSKNGLHIGAILFFALCSLVGMLCVVLYAYAFPKLPIVKYYRSKAAKEGSKTVCADLVAAGVSLDQQKDVEDPNATQRLSTKDLFWENIDYCLDLYIIYAVTLSIFPGFISEDTGSHSLGTWYVLVLVAAYNVADLIGRYTPLINALKIQSRRLLLCLCLSRLLFVPAFYFAAKYGNQGWMIMLISFLGLTNGHLTICALTEAPKGYKGPEQNALGNVLTCFLLSGIFSGVTLDWLWLIGKGW